MHQPRKPTRSPSCTWSGPGPLGFRPTLLVLLIGILAAGCTPQPPDSEPGQRDLTRALEGWNVWLLSVDTLRADRLGSYGYEQRDTSPRIDELLSGGVRFATASSPRAITWPSLATVLTGQFPSHHGLIQNGFEFAEGQSTISSVLSDVGYDTAAFLSNMCQANHQRWQSFSCTGGQDEKVNQQTLEWARARQDDSRPFLLWTHYFGAHSPYYNGGDLAQQLDPGYEGPVAPKKGVLNRIMSDRIELNERDLQHLDALYDAAVMGTDQRIGRLLDQMSEIVDLDRTLIVFFSDHGEDLYQHNRYLYHACSVYETSLRVPLAFVAPGAIGGDGISEEPAELTDVLPTILDLLGLRPPELEDDMDGRRLTDWLAAPESADGSPHPVITEYHYGETNLHTLRFEHKKLILNPDAVTPDCIPGGPSDLYRIEPVELYDLSSDPYEQANLAAQRLEEVRSLRAILEDRRFRLGLTDASAERQEIDEELKRQLEELGYVVE